MRRFMFSSIRKTCPVRRASVILKFAFGKPSPGPRLPRQTTISIASRNSFELESYKPRSNEVQRSESHSNHSSTPRRSGRQPPLSVWPAKSAANEEQRCREAESPESEQPVSGMFERRKICIKDCGENKKPDEPGKLDAGTAVTTGRNVLERLRSIAAVASASGTIHSARASFTVVPITNACGPYFVVAPTTELVSWIASAAQSPN